MKTIKQYYTLAEHANVEAKPYYPSALKWSYLMPDMPSSAA